MTPLQAAVLFETGRALNNLHQHQSSHFKIRRGWNSPYCGKCYRTQSRVLKAALLIQTVFIWDVEK